MKIPGPVKIGNGYFHRLLNAKGEPLNIPYGADIQHYLDKGCTIAPEPKTEPAKKGK